MSEVLNYDNYIINKPKKPIFETQKSRFYSDLKNNPNFQELHQKQLQESKELEKSNEQQKQNITNETHETLDKEAIISSAKKSLYESLGIKEDLLENSSLENFTKGIIDEFIFGNRELAIEVINTKGEILIDAISRLLTWEGLKNLATSLGESIWNLFDGDAYKRGKTVAELGLIGAGLSAGVVLGKKGLKVGLKEIAKHSVNKENLVKSEGLKEVVKETNTNVANIIPKKQFDQEKLLIEYIAKLGDQDRVLAGKMLLKRDLSETEQKAILESHYVGENRAEAGINNYNFAEKRQKYIILKNAGFAEDEIKTLMQKGVCGKLQEKQLIDYLDRIAEYDISKIDYIKPKQAIDKINDFTLKIDVEHLINSPKRFTTTIGIINGMCDYIDKNELKILSLDKNLHNELKGSIVDLKNKLYGLSKNDKLDIHSLNLLNVFLNKKFNKTYSNLIFNK